MDQKNQLSSFKEYRLSEERIELQKLVWICQMKKSTFKGFTRELLNLKRNRQFEVVESSGISLLEIAQKTKFYECFLELVNN